MALGRCGALVAAWVAGGLAARPAPGTAAPAAAGRRGATDDRLVAESGRAAVSGTGATSPGRSRSDTAIKAELRAARHRGAQLQGEPLSEPWEVYEPRRRAVQGYSRPSGAPGRRMGEPEPLPAPAPVASRSPRSGRRARRLAPAADTPDWAAGLRAPGRPARRQRGRATRLRRRGARRLRDAPRLSRRAGHVAPVAASALRRVSPAPGLASRAAGARGGRSEIPAPSSAGASSPITCCSPFPDLRDAQPRPRIRPLPLGRPTPRTLAPGSAGRPATRSSTPACASSGRPAGCTTACA